MNSEQTSPPQRSSCAAWFVIGVGVVIVLISIGAGLLFNVWDLPVGGECSAAIGKAMPGLDLSPITLNENPVSLADLSGKVTLVNFWATWCGPCRAELPEIAELGEEFEDNKDFLLLPVSCGNEDPMQLSSDSVLMLRDMELEMPCYSDPTGQTQQALAKISGAPEMSLPTTLVLDRKGVVRGIWIGFRSGQGKKMKKLIAELLDEKTKS